jgi:metal-dependent amidase/aminoacylase/carboxypeptidase family protein
MAKIAGGMRTAAPPDAPTEEMIPAAVDNFELRFAGTGAHAAMPHLGDDPILAAGEFIGSVQRIVSRSIAPLILRHRWLSA